MGDKLLLSLPDRSERKGYRRLHQPEETLLIRQQHQAEAGIDRERHKPEPISEETLEDNVIFLSIYLDFPPPLYLHKILIVKLDSHENAQSFPFAIVIGPASLIGNIKREEHPDPIQLIQRNHTL